MYPWSAITPSLTLSCACTAARYMCILGQPLHLLLPYPVPALLPGICVSLVSHYTFSYPILCLHCCQVHVYPWSAITPSLTLSCACTAARYMCILGQPLHLLVPYPVPALLPGTCVSLVSHYTVSYPILCLHCCLVHVYPWSAITPFLTLSCACTAAWYMCILGQPLHLLLPYPVPALLPGTCVSLVSHYTFSYPILGLHCCLVHVYPWSAITPSLTLSCACTTARYTNALGQPLHFLILYPVSALLPKTLMSLVSHCTFSYPILFLHCCQEHPCPWSSTASSLTLSCSYIAARNTHALGQPLHLLLP